MFNYLVPDSDAKRFGPRETSEQKKKSFQLKSIFGVRQVVLF